MKIFRRFFFVACMFLPAMLVRAQDYSGVTVVGGEAGSLMLSGPNTYTGDLDFNGGVLTSGALNLDSSGGTLLVSGPTPISGGTLSLSSGSEAGTLTISGGTLSLNGSEVGTLTFNGTLLTNNSDPSELTFNIGSYEIPTNNTLTLSSAATTTVFDSSLSFDLSSSLVLNLNTQTGTSGMLSIEGNLTLDQTNLQLIDQAANSQALPIGTTFTLAHYTGTESGVFYLNGQPLTDGSTFTDGANTYQINYASGDPNVVIDVIPEPSILSLLGCGAAALIFFRCRRSNAALAYLRDRF